MSQYALTKDGSVLRDDGVSIPPDDRNPDYLEYQTWVTAGGVASPYVAPVISLSVTPRQARLALLGAGLLDQVEAAVKAAGGAAQITWDYATQINRDDALLITLGVALNLSSAQIDQLFATASTL